MTKRVLMVTTVPVTLEAFLLPLADALHETGWQVDALTGTTDDPVLAGDAEKLTQHFEQIHHIGWNRSVRSLTRTPQLARTIRTLVEKGAYTVVHVHTPIAAFITRMALARMPAETRPRILYTVHGFHFDESHPLSLGERLFKHAEQVAIHTTDDLVVMNDRDEQAARTLVARTKGSARLAMLHRIDGTGLYFSAYLNFPPPAEVRTAQRAALGIPADAFVVGMIAELNANKRHRLIVEAARLFAQRPTAAHRTEADDSRTTESPINFLLIGTGPLETSLKQTVASHGLADRIHFTGQLPHDEVRDLIRICDLGILVSRREGLPRSLMEFIASGVPVIGTATRGITDVVGDRAALCDATPQALAALIDRYATDSQQRTSLAQQQYTRARARYDTSVVIGQYLKLYRPITAGARATAPQRVSTLHSAPIPAPANSQ